MLSSSFPRTWAYLQSHKGQLEQRPPVKTGRLPWWQPERPRFDYLLRPKIVSPHLVVVPRFSLDQAGEYAITRSPLLYPKGKSVEQDLLRFFLAVLNSTPY